MTKDETAAALEAAERKLAFARGQLQKISEQAAGQIDLMNDLDGGSTAQLRGLLSSSTTIGELYGMANAALDATDD